MKQSEKAGNDGVEEEVGGGVQNLRGEPKRAVRG